MLQLRFRPVPLGGVEDDGDAARVTAGRLEERRGGDEPPERRPVATQEPDLGRFGGSSFGGVLALHAGLTHPGVFSRIAALSTSAWIDDRFLVRFVDALAAKPDTRIWTDIGTREASSAVADARALRDALVRKGWREGEDLRHVEAEGGVHDETAWAKRMPEVLEFLFPPGGAATPAPSATPSAHSGP